MNDFQDLYIRDLYIRGLLIIDILQASVVYRWLLEASDFFNTIWLQPREPSSINLNNKEH